MSSLEIRVQAPAGLGLPGPEGAEAFGGPGAVAAAAAGGEVVSASGNFQIAGQPGHAAGSIRHRAAHR
eukprot:CAMPEP_0184294694 /NCGR_PEP_ID=MMETSP1049-20130417/5819_1 /TAXON_ID=77928 /ORGANISM="Proteomonas sulcata, Strain CCMP704" /LENGTH=67 /DNA_ID=CAMNT_0026603059 /DNA_START=260 /DNA_END=460 /DNA_ORIENTATION=+